MPSYRCTYLVFDNDKNVNRKCKKKIYFKELCKSHSKIVYNKFASLIQARFIGNKIRSKIKNIYSLLPDDIQKIIIDKMRQDHYYRNYYSTLNKIIYKKVLNVVYENGYLFTLYDYCEYNVYRNLNELFVDTFTDFSIYMKNLEQIYTLINKYFSILNINKHIFNILYILSNGIYHDDYPILCNEMMIYSDNYYFN